MWRSWTLRDEEANSISWQEFEDSPRFCLANCATFSHLQRNTQLSFARSSAVGPGIQLTLRPDVHKVMHTFCPASLQFWIVWLCLFSKHVACICVLHMVSRRSDLWKTVTVHLTVAHLQKNLRHCSTVPYSAGPDMQKTSQNISKSLFYVVRIESYRISPSPGLP